MTAVIREYVKRLKQGICTLDEFIKFPLLCFIQVFRYKGLDTGCQPIANRAQANMQSHRILGITAVEFCQANRNWLSRPLFVYLGDATGRPGYADLSLVFIGRR